MTHKQSYWTVLIALFVSMILAPIVYGQALMVEPKRIVLNAKQRSAIANLYNPTNDTVSYSISWLHLRMDQNGQFTIIDSVKPEDHVADSLVRFFPPEVTLPPHGAQVVRLRFLKPRNLPEEEYRTHLQFSEVTRGLAIEKTLHDTSSRSLAVRFRPVWSIAIPVFVRNDSVPAMVHLDSVTLSAMDTGRNVDFGVNIYRAGTESSYGTIVVKYLGAGGNEKQLALFKGVSVYPPLTSRRFNQYFKVPEEVDLRKGKLIIEYQPGEGERSGQVSATTQLALG